MNKNDSIEQLCLAEHLKEIFRKNDLVSVGDYLDSAIRVCLLHFELNINDWLNLICVFEENNAVKNIHNKTVAALANQQDRAYDVVLINVMGEKYVVCALKKGKRLFPDFIFKALVEGIVFLNREDAEVCCRIIQRNYSSTIHKLEIETANRDIRVVVAYSLQTEKCTFSINKANDTKEILFAFAEESYLFDTRRAIELAEENVKKINMIYDYEIASLIYVLCDEEAKTVEEVSYDTFSEYTSKKRMYIQIRAFEEVLHKLYDPTDESYFGIGKKSALDEVLEHNVSWLTEKIKSTEQTLASLNEDFGATEDDILYFNGYREGLCCALEMLEQYEIHDVRVRVAVVDCYGILSDVEKGSIGERTEQTVANVTVEICMFSTLQEMDESGEMYDGYYFLVGRTLSYEMQDEMYRMQREFYEKTQKNLHSVGITRRNTLEKRVVEATLHDLFTKLTATGK